MVNINKYIGLNLSCEITKKEIPVANTILYQINRILSFEINRTSLLFEQVLPNHIRKPRGLFNFLGTFQKSITGTLDANDGERYEENFKRMFNNEDKIKIDIEKHLSITNDLITTTNKSIITLVENQRRINTAMADIQTKIERIGLCIHLLGVQNILEQLSHSLSLICNLLEELSTAISFAQLRQMHQTIIKPNNLREELIDIQNHLKEVNLPFEPTFQNIMKYEKLCKTSVFQKDSYTYFIIKIPLIEKIPYDYYRLYPLPIQKNDSYITIIPQRNYLLMKPNWYSYSDIPCEEIETRKFICMHNSIIQRKTNEPCEVQLIDYSQNQNNCRFTKINIINPKIQRIENSNSWIITSPSTIIAETNCEEKKKKQLRGNYLLTIPNRCYSIIDKYKLTPNTNFQTKLEPIDIPMLNIQNNSSILNYHTNIPTMDHLNLDEFSELSRRTENLQEEIKNQILESDLNQPNSWLTYTLITTVIIAVLIILWTLWSIYAKYKNKRVPIFNIFSSKTEEKPQDMETTNVGSF